MGGGASKNKKKKRSGLEAMECMQIGIAGLSKSDDSSSLIPSVSNGSDATRDRRRAASEAQGSSLSEIELSSQGSKSIGQTDSRTSVEMDEESQDTSNDSADSKKPMQIKPSAKPKLKPKGKALATKRA